MKSKFMTAVGDSDVLTVRLFLSNELLLDPRGKSFKKMLTYAAMNITQLYEVHNGEVFTEDQSLWDESLLFSVKNDLDSNFSKERLEYFERLADVVLKEKVKALKEEDKKPLKQSEQTKHPEECKLSDLSRDKELTTEKLITSLKHIPEIFIDSVREGLSKVKNKYNNESKI